MPSVLPRLLQNLVSANIINRDMQHEAAYNKPFNTLLRYMFGPAYDITAEYHIAKSRESIDFVVSGADESPSLFIEVKSPFNFNNDSRHAQADDQMHNRFHQLRPYIKVPRLIGISAFGTRLAFYKTTPSQTLHEWVGSDQSQSDRVCDGVVVVAGQSSAEGADPDESGYLDVRPELVEAVAHLVVRLRTPGVVVEIEGRLDLNEEDGTFVRPADHEVNGLPRCGDVVLSCYIERGAVAEEAIERGVVGGLVLYVLVDVICGDKMLEHARGRHFAGCCVYMKYPNRRS